MANFEDILRKRGTDATEAKEKDRLIRYLEANLSDAAKTAISTVLERARIYGFIEFIANNGNYYYQISESHGWFSTSWYVQQFRPEDGEFFFSISDNVHVGKCTVYQLKE